jgi:ABC-type methionine transport system ATPase subunit
MTRRTKRGSIGNAVVTILRLNYPPALVSRPVVSNLVNSFGLEVNILRAQVTREEGWLILEIGGDPVKISAATEWLTKEGIELVENPELDAIE